MTIGQKIKYVRKKRKITQDGLASLSGIHLVSIAKYETDKMQPQLAQLKRIAEALSINPYALSDLDMSDGIDSDGDVLGLVLQFCKHNIMSFQGERLEDGALDSESAKLKFNDSFMGMFAASSFGEGIFTEYGTHPYKENEINANTIRLRPFSSQIESDLLLWEQANYFYKKAKYMYQTEQTPEALEEMETRLSRRDEIELGFFLSLGDDLF